MANLFIGALISASTTPSFTITDFGATENGRSDNAAAIQRAIDLCGEQGGGRVVVPAGAVFVSGTIQLRSGVELHVETGATLAAIDRDDGYTLRRRTTGLAGGPSDEDPDLSTMFITAEGCQRISITGGGTIDGGGQHFMIADFGHAYEMKHVRPYTIFFIDCDDVVIRDVRIEDGAYWTVRVSGCRGVLIHSLTIRNDLKLPNSDGIDIDTCQRVRISDCDIITGDDGICIKTCSESRQYGSCEDVVITGCTIMSTSSAICFGSEMASPIRNCVISSCIVSASNRGLSMQLSEAGTIDNILFSDIIIETRFFDPIWWGHGEPIYIAAYPWRGASGHTRTVRFRNILARSENGVLIRSEEDGCITGLVFDGVRIEIDRWSGRAGGHWDLRPHPTDGLIEHDTSGFHLERVSDVTLRDCEVAWAQPPGERSEDLQHALNVNLVDGLRLSGFRGDGATARSAAFVRDGQPESVPR